MMNKPPKRHIRFAPIKSPFSSSSATQPDGPREPQGKFRRRKHGLAWRLKRFVIWEWLAIGCLVLSTLLFLVAFNTNGWGYIEVLDPYAPALRRDGYNATAGEFWKFGLWECCRHDGFCLGSRFPPFYIATRVLCVLSLFGHMVTLLWFIGQSIEKLVKYDVCAYSTLISFVWFTALCLLITVVSFGTRWPIEFTIEFHATSVQLSYAFYICVVCCLLMFTAGAMILIYMIKTRNKFRVRKDKFVTAEELLEKDTEQNL